jgi:hypothetical protein
MIRMMRMLIMIVVGVIVITGHSGQEHVQLSLLMIEHLTDVTIHQLDAAVN